MKTNVKHGQQYSTGGENTESTAGKGMKEEEYMQEKCEKIEGQEKKKMRREEVKENIRARDDRKEKKERNNYRQ